MALKLLFFAQLADLVKVRETEIQISQPVSLLGILKSSPAFAPILSHLKALKVAINQEFADFDAEVRDGDEVAIFPPFSGG